MATRVTPRSAQLALELAGAPAGALRTVQPPSVRVDRVAIGPGSSPLRRSGGNVVLGEMAAEFDLAAPGPLVDWLRTLTQGAARPTTGAVQVLDLNFNEQRRIDFVDGVLTGLTLPVLSAVDGRSPVTVGLSWQPVRVADGKGGGKAVKPVIGKRKVMLRSNFRVQGLPFDGSAVLSVAPPTLRTRLATTPVRQPVAHYAAVEVGELLLVLGGRSVEPARAWATQLLADGRLDASEYLDLGIELLDASLKTVLATVQLKGCGLLALEEPRIEAASEVAPTLGLRFTVEQLDLQVSA